MEDSPECVVRIQILAQIGPKSEEAPFEARSLNIPKLSHKAASVHLFSVNLTFFLDDRRANFPPAPLGALFHQNLSAFYPRGIPDVSPCQPRLSFHSAVPQVTGLLGL